MHKDQYAYNVLGAGYINTTSAVNNIKFDFHRLLVGKTKKMRPGVS